MGGKRRKGPTDAVGRWRAEAIDAIAIAIAIERLTTADWH